MLPELLQFKVHADERGKLVALEKDGGIPFAPVCTYIIYGASGQQDGHAHRNLEEVFIAMSGSCTVLVDDGETRKTIRLDAPNAGLHINSVMWREVSDFSADCVLVVLANAPHEEADCIRDYEEFCRVAAERKK